MKYILMATGSLVLGLATLMWVAAPSSGAPPHGSGHPPSGGHPGGGHPGPAHAGSIHYGGGPTTSHVAPGRPGPAVRSGAVRSAHYAGSSSWGSHRNPYRDDYFRRFRPGWSFYLLDDVQYVGYDSLPSDDCQTVVMGDITYFLCDDVYYQPYIYDGQTVYIVVPTQ